MYSLQWDSLVRYEERFGNRIGDYRLKFGGGPRLPGLVLLICRSD